MLLGGHRNVCSGDHAHETNRPYDLWHSPIGRVVGSECGLRSDASAGVLDDLADEVDLVGAVGGQMLVRGVGECSVAVA